MSFVDRATIEIRAGRGGDGAVSFLREAFRPRGGPDGGNGGNGGSVLLRVTTHRSSLRDLASRRHYHAENGRPGGTKNMTGARGEELVLEVPPGTLVYDVSAGELEEGAAPIADLTDPGQEFRLGRGGRGGRGNASFATALNQVPRVATMGQEGQSGTYQLELKLIAEVGIVGLPNAGKSTFISRVSNAKPKIASYPFTTLVPNLGVVSFGYDKELVIADIPGLIEGASEGKGLGDDFLRHVERTTVLLHLIDVTGPELGGLEPLEAYQTIRRELERYPKAALDQKAEVVALNKCEALSPEEVEARASALSAVLGREVRRISAVSGEGCREVLEELVELLRPSAKDEWEVEG